MIKVTVDLFSGRPNPSWIINDSRGDDLLEKLSKNQGLISKPGTGYDGLGFRGITFELMGDEKEGNLPSSFTIANGLARDQKGTLSLAEEVVKQMLRYEKLSMDVSNTTPIDQEMQKIVLGAIRDYEKNLDKIKKYLKKKPLNAKRAGIRVTTPDQFERSSCMIEVSQFNPNFWNAAHVRPHNNCYNYGRNWRTDTFAQPGRASGSTASSMTCAAVSAAAKRDGLVPRGNCLPQSEYPRRLLALVIAPGKDYHWYRLQKGGFWGHKPGSTNARNVDNSGVIITNPETCNRGAGTYLNYTDFCGYFYAGKSVVIR